MIDYNKIAKVELTKGYYAIVDEENLSLIKGINWSANMSKKGIPNSAMATVNGQTIRMHRLLMNAKKGEMIDHINGDPLDNRKDNLRFCDKSQNLLNNKSLGGSTPYKGVHQHKNGKYRATLTLGMYDTAEEAAKVYDKAARQYHKEFVRPNFFTEKEKEKFELVNRDNIKTTILKKESKPRTSRFKGVSWHKRVQQWVAQIHSNEKYHIGYFENEAEAALAYDYKAIQLRGIDKAYLNFPWLHDVGFQTKVL